MKKEIIIVGDSTKIGLPAKDSVKKSMPYAKWMKRKTSRKKK